MDVVRKRDDCIHEPVCALCGAISCPAECDHYIKVEKFTSYNKQSTPLQSCVNCGSETCGMRAGFCVNWFPK